jgi:gluconolactonase
MLNKTTTILACCFAAAAACSQETPVAEPERPPLIEAELIASDPSWGNTEGPAVDSNGTLYFTSRGSFKGIVSWTEAEGVKEHLAVAEMEGPGGLWIDEQDNIYLTATGERQILKVSPDLEISVVAENFESDPTISKGPNDLVVASDGVIFFTAPNGFDSLAPDGTVYRSTPDGETAVFSANVSGPNGVVLSMDENTLYVSHNIDATDGTRIVAYPILADGHAGDLREVAVVRPCRADGMALNRDGNLWLTCYSFGMAYLFDTDGAILETISVEQKALTNIVFGRAGTEAAVYLTSSDMDRQTGYIYRAEVSTPGLR